MSTTEICCNSGCYNKPSRYSYRKFCADCDTAADRAEELAREEHACSPAGLAEVALEEVTTIEEVRDFLSEHVLPRLPNNQGVN